MHHKAKQDVGARLKTIRRELRLTQTRFAETVGGCSQAFLSQVESGKHGPSTPLLAGLARLGFSVDWLMSGDGQMRPEPGAPTDRVCERPLLYGLKEIPLVGEIAAGLGKSIPDDDIERSLPMFLGQHTDCQCFASKVTGKSMDPLFRAGDIVVIDKTCPVTDNDIAVVCADDQVMLKRVSMDGDSVYLLSVNTNVPPIRISRSSDSARIVGKVIQLLRTRF